MSISDLGSIGEFVSSIGVLITLIYLAVQVRYTRNVALGHSYQTRVGFRIDAHLYNGDPQISELFTRVGPVENTDKCVENYNGLTDIQKAQYRELTHAQILLCDNTLYQHSLGLIGEEQMLLAAGRVQMAYGFWVYITPYIPPHVQRNYEEYKDKTLSGVLKVHSNGFYKL